MDPILIKIFATALTLSQVTTAPEEIRTQFDPAQDRDKVVQLLRDGCTHMRRAFDIEDINLDELIATAMDDPQAIASESKAFRGINFGDLHTAYRQFCKGETVANSPVEIEQVIDFYNKAVADLPDHTTLKSLKLPSMSVVLGADGERLAEVFEPDHRRIWVALSEIPAPVQKAFVAAEDKRFYQHKGIDERGLIRAFVGNLADPGRPQGGSTITQQVAKMLLVGDDVTYERKMREMIVASRLERTLTKGEILEIYLNALYLGRFSWGVEMAARSYFEKPAKALTLTEGALLAGLTKGPNHYSPDRRPERAKERQAYVLSRMQEDGIISADDMQAALAEPSHVIPFDRPERDLAFHFVDQLAREAKGLSGIDGLTARSYSVRSTLNPALQRATETAMQDGLARYELNNGRYRFAGPEANLADDIRQLEKTKSGDSAQLSWQLALANARLPLYDVHWPAAVIVEKARAKSGEIIRVGLEDGRILPLNTLNAAIRRNLKLYDVVYVSVVEAKGKTAPRADLRVRPTVQGAAVVLENKSGRILAMAGGFSYPLSQLNRATQTQRQPGSALKPLTYLAALAHGLQPNTLVWDSPITLPPVGGTQNARRRDYWTPKNYDSRNAGAVTLRRALENSKNLVTARLLDGGISYDPAESLDQVCRLTLEAHLYTECVRHYPFVLGAQPVRPIDLAGFYAAVANEGGLPTPYAIESVEQDGKVIYRRKLPPLPRIGSADQAAFYQLKSILQGTLERGTARSISHLAPYVAGKTGTTDNENDAWFVGFTNDVTIAVWVGYDNADGKRRTLGRGQTGSKVALPIFEPILQAAWRHHAPQTALNPPSPTAQARLVALPIDLRSGEEVTGGYSGAFTEYFRTDRFGNIAETQYRLVAREQAYASRYDGGWIDGEAAGGWGNDRGWDGRWGNSGGWGNWWGGGGDQGAGSYEYDNNGRYVRRQAPRNEWPPQAAPRQAAPRQGPYGPQGWSGPQGPQQPRRVDPDYLWGDRRLY